MDTRALEHAQPTAATRPTLTADNAVEYLDWATRNIGSHSARETEVHLRAAELAIRTKANEAQAKATQHTLVEDGVIEAPPIAK